MSDAQDRYQLTGLPGGRYELRVVLTGFKTEVQAVELKADAVVDFSLGVELQEQIVVTALRRAERLQDVPAAIDAFDAGMIEQAGITSMRDYVGMAPQSPHRTACTWCASFSKAGGTHCRSVFIRTDWKARTDRTA